MSRIAELDYDKQVELRAQWRKRSAKYRITAKGKINNAKKRDKERALYPYKDKARNLLKYAVLKGAVVKPSQCEKQESCEGRLEGHHPDYSQPLMVNWLCKKHHVAVHRGEINVYS